MRAQERLRDTGGLTLAGLAVGGVLAGLALPKLIKSGRFAVTSIGGMTFTSGAAGGPRPQPDPARGRPA
jgi:hypothetical protein